MSVATRTRTAERTRFLADVVIGALEGGIGYWACALRYKWYDGEDVGKTQAIIYIDDDEHEELLHNGIANFVSNEGRKPNARELLEYGLTEEDQETPLLYMIDIDAIAKGIGIVRRTPDFCSSQIRKWIVESDRENDASMIDADAADVIVQAAVFGELVYG